MQITNIHDAKTHFSKLIEKVRAGKEIIIGKGGKPVAKLVPYLEDRKERIPGKFKGTIWISEDFNDESEIITDMFYGKTSK